MHWVLYLREDIQEIRQDLRQLHDRIDQLYARVDSRFSLLLMTMVALFGMTIGYLEYRLPPL